MPNDNYKSPRNISKESQGPEFNFQNEFHASHSSASGRWVPCQCHNGDYNAHFEGLRQILKAIVAEKGLSDFNRKKASNG